MNEKIYRVLTSTKSYSIQNGLIRDVEYNVVRIVLPKHADSDVTKPENQFHAESASNLVSTQAMSCTVADDAESLSDILISHTLPISFLSRLVAVASDGACNRVLITLCVKYGADPDYIDRLSGRIVTTGDCSIG